LLAAVATKLLTAPSAYLRAVDRGRFDRNGLERTERASDKVVLQAAGDDTGRRDFCCAAATRDRCGAAPRPPPRSSCRSPVSRTHSVLRWTALATSTSSTVATTALKLGSAFMGH